MTADEVSDPDNLEMIARVYGEEWGRGKPGKQPVDFRGIPIDGQ